MPDVAELELLHSRICQALGDPKRILIMFLLHDEPMCVSELAEALEAPQPTISRHLSVLRQRSLVIREQQGTSAIYRLSDPRIIEVLNAMRQLLRDIIGEQAELMG